MQDGYTRHGLNNKNVLLRVENNNLKVRNKQLESFFDARQLLELEVSSNGSQMALMPVKLEISFWKWECPLCGSGYVENEKGQQVSCKVCNVNFNVENGK